MYSLNFESQVYSGQYIEVIVAEQSGVRVHLCEKSGSEMTTICAVEIYSVSGGMRLANELDVPIRVVD